MNREIKFRAWDKRDKVVRVVYALKFKKYSNKGTRHEDIVEMHCSDYEGQRAIILSHFERPLQDIILMQYTGLKDKQGREVYEGDIVKYDTSWGNELFRRGIGEVVWHGSRFCMNEGGKELDYWKSQEDLEVIGNVFENPQILDEKRSAE